MSDSMNYILDLAHTPVLLKMLTVIFIWDLKATCKKPFFASFLLHVDFTIRLKRMMILYRNALYG